MAPGGEQRAAPDAVIVGAGAIGLACAWRAARRGLQVRVVERGAPGSGATWASGGMIAPVGEASWGEEPIVELNLASAERWPGFAAELERASGRPVGYRRCGALHVALDRDEVAELRRRHELQLRLGLKADWVGPVECRRLEPGLAPAAGSGVHAAHEAQADPRALIAALEEALEREGAEVVAGAEVTDALIEGGRLCGARTADGREHRAGAVVLATGCWSGVADWLPPEARPPVRPVKGEIITLRGPEERPVCERIVVTEWVYLVPRGDGRLVVGATAEERGFDVTVTAGGVHHLLREAYRALPEIAELELAEAIAGLRPASPDNAPLIGPGAIEGLVVATGHWRHGILLAPATADAVAALLAGEEPPRSLRPFDPTRFGSKSRRGDGPA
ncbi:MAG: glycine oxidase ThiO [Solirubrobacterales bacterium]|nr:glycine oxidase ThiO [Solirubrobacterales bacterium]